MEQTAFRYFGKSFDLCKKHGRLHPKLDIQDMEIDNELAREGDEGKDEKEEEKDEDEDEDEDEGYQDTNPLSP